jgi:hypothetical protein
MMPALNNPAGRLYSIMIEVRRAPDNQLMRQVGAKIFGIAETNTRDILSVVIEMLGLLARTRKAIESRNDIDQEPYLKPIASIEEAFKLTNIDTQYVQFKRFLPDSVMTGLEFCSDKLARTMGEEMIEQSTLDELRTEVEAMISEFLVMDIDRSLMAVIIDHLEAIRQAILHYRINGASGLKRALDSGIGSLARHREDLKKPENRHWTGKLLTLLGRIDGYVALAVGAKRLFGHVAELLQLGDK